VVNCIYYINKVNAIDYNVKTTARSL
jgi:hypothetical protein